MSGGAGREGWRESRTERLARGSAFQRLLGYRVESWGEGRAVVSCPLRPEHLNMSDRPHGGLVATLIDAVCGIAGSREPASGRDSDQETGHDFGRDAGGRHITVTISLTVNYLAAAEGDRLVAEGRRTGGGRGVFFSQAEVRDGVGRLVATGSGAFRVRPAPGGSAPGKPSPSGPAS